MLLPFYKTVGFILGSNNALNERVVSTGTLGHSVRF